MLNFIYIEPESEVHEAEGNCSCGDGASSSSATASEQDLEGQLMAIEERWTILSDWNEERCQTLGEVSRHWRRFEAEREAFMQWLDRAELELRNMERSPTEEVPRLETQADHIQVRRHQKFSLFCLFFGL